MSELVNELKQEHKDITAVLIELKNIGASSDEGMALLAQSEALLLNHLSKEDNQLYPPLHEKAKYDFSFKVTLDTFGTEMEEITKFVLGFYKKYINQDKINRTEFVNDISKFISALKNRIMKEEVAIYRAFEKLKID